MKPDKPILQRNPVVWYGPNHALEFKGIDRRYWHCSLSGVITGDNSRPQKESLFCPHCSNRVEKSTDLFDYTIKITEVYEWIWSQRIGVRFNKISDRKANISTFRIRRDKN